jgi:hypothetical protein
VSSMLWCLLLRCNAAMISCLSKIAANQNLTSYEEFSCSNFEYDYLKKRLGDVDTVFARTGVHSFLVLANSCNTREVRKLTTTKTTIRIDTDAKLECFKGVIGKNTCRVVRKCRPKTPKMKYNQKFGFSSDRLHTTDGVNAVYNLGNEVNLQYIKYTQKRGIDLLYNPEKCTVKLCVRYLHCLGKDLPANELENNTEITSHPFQCLQVKIGMSFHVNSVGYTVQSVENDNAVCRVVESCSEFLVVGDERSFS